MWSSGSGDGEGMGTRSRAFEDVRAHHLSTGMNSLSMNASEELLLYKLNHGALQEKERVSSHIFYPKS